MSACYLYCFPIKCCGNKYKTVRLIYNTDASIRGKISRRIAIASYDNWLKDIIVSLIVFEVSIVLLAAVLLISIIRKRQQESLKKHDIHFFKNADVIIIVQTNCVIKGLFDKIVTSSTNHSASLDNFLSEAKHRLGNFLLYNH